MPPPVRINATLAVPFDGRAGRGVLQADGVAAPAAAVTGLAVRPARCYCLTGWSGRSSRSHFGSRTVGSSSSGRDQFLRLMSRTRTDPDVGSPDPAVSVQRQRVEHLRRSSRSDPYPGRPAAARLAMPRQVRSQNHRSQQDRQARTPIHGDPSRHLRVQRFGLPFALPALTPHWPGAGCPVAPAARDAGCGYHGGGNGGLVRHAFGGPGKLVPGGGGANIGPPSSSASDSRVGHVRGSG